MSQTAVHVNNNNGHQQLPNPIYESSPTFQMACRQLESIAEQCDIEPGILERLRWPKRAMVVSVPIRMADGTTQVFSGYRVQHNLTSGPSKGGLRYHPSVDLGEVADELAGVGADPEVLDLARVDGDGVGQGSALQDARGSVAVAEAIVAPAALS